MSLAEDLNEGQRLWAAEKWDEAMARYLSALAQEPRQFTAMRRLWKRGTTTQDLGLFSRVLEVVPKPSGHQDVDLYLARMARMLGRPEQTEQFRSQVERQCRESIRGGSADQWMSQKLLGNVLRDFGGEAQLRESVEVFGGSLANAPPAEHAGVHNDRGMTYRCLGSLADAERDFRDAIRLKGDITEAHTNLAQALLLQGKLEEGWREWEWRFGPPGRPRPPAFGQGSTSLSGPSRATATRFRWFASCRGYGKPARESPSSAGRHSAISFATAASPTPSSSEEHHPHGMTWLCR